MRKVAVVIALVTGLGLLSPPVMAASELASARVSIVPAININEEAEIDFGQLSNIDGTCYMSSGGTLSGTTGMDCVGSQAPGVFSISGLIGAVINISVTQGSIDGVTFDPVIDGELSRTLANGSTTVTILGSLTLNNALDGDKNISYTFTANYE